MKKLARGLDRDLVVDGEKPRRFSMRFFWVGLFVAVAAIMVIPAMARYASQQEDLRALRQTLETTEQHNSELQHELDLWKDDDFVRSQARARLGYVMPGEQLYIVNDPNRGAADEQLQKRVEQVNRERRKNTPWYVTLSDSIMIAGESSDGEPVTNPHDTPVIMPSGGAPSEGEGGGAPSGEATPADGTSATAEPDAQ